ncbi:hypothetical protein BaRGS_00015940 [Batillaria attramentaria]|uniref:Uncharacterized protein n=1 Tax=Batillaria attramentaria TaxID=370345 RepID=A0ABD0L063_9CAEN
MQNISKDPPRPGAKEKVWPCCRFVVPRVLSPSETRSTIDPVNSTRDEQKQRRAGPCHAAFDRSTAVVSSTVIGRFLRKVKYAVCWFLMEAI